jgi:apolipoprotein N-acyltransferase
VTPPPLRVWLNPALAILAGLLAAVAFPPWGFWPGLFGYALMLWLADNASTERPVRSAFFRGWLAGAAFFTVSCWWVAQAFMVDKENQGWMALPAVVLLAAGMALFWGAASALYKRIAPAHAGRVFVFAAVFGVIEWLRGHVLTGFPWNLPGETFRAGSSMSQGAALVGAYGMTTLTVFMYAAFAPLFAPGERKRRAGMAALGALSMLTLWIFGAARLSGASQRTTDLMVRVVQPDVPQQTKWRPGELQRIVQKYVNLTASPGRRRLPDVVVWPEGALPGDIKDILADDSWVKPEVAQALAPGETLFLGAYRSEPGAKGSTVYYNSLIGLQRSGANDLRQVDVYDKYRLVPFGEYMPLDGLMGMLGVKTLTHVGDSFSAGRQPSPMKIPGAPAVQPLICYEGLYPGLARDGGQRPGWILNVSNDAWFGPTSGPYQHLNLASYRSIEAGVPMVRATPTGVSAVIDAYGRPLPNDEIGERESGVIDALLPVTAPPTLYSRVGDLGFLLLTLAGLCFAVPWRRVRDRLKPNEG